MKLIAPLTATIAALALAAIFSATGAFAQMISIAGIYTGSVTENGRVIYFSLTVSPSTDQTPESLHGSLTVGGGPEFAILHFPVLIHDTNAGTLSGDGSGVFRGHPMQISLNCKIAQDTSLDCISKGGDGAVTDVHLARR